MKLPAAAAGASWGTMTLPLVARQDYAAEIVTNGDPLVSQSASGAEGIVRNGVSARASGDAERDVHKAARRTGFRGRHVSVSMLVATAMLVLAACPTLAWTQSSNNFDALSDDPDFPDVHGQPESCTNEEPYWCIEWPLINGTSSTVYVYLDPNLSQANNLPGETLNLKQQARNAFGRWNDVPAYNPWLFEATSINDATGAGYPYNCPTYIRRSVGLPLGVLGQTTVWTHYDRVFTGSHTKIVCFYLYLSYTLKFDTDSDPEDGFMDARWTLGHELGHGEGLGHSARTTIMYPFWPNAKYMGINPTTNDIDGMQAIYGAL